jgi:hypothetical protein
MVDLLFGATLLSTSQGGAPTTWAAADLGALRLALGMDDGERPAAAAAADAAVDRGSGRPPQMPPPPPPPPFFARAFAAHALTPSACEALGVPPEERLEWAPRAALGDMLRTALAEAEAAVGGDGSSAASAASRPLRRAELDLWFPCVDAERGGALVPLREYSAGVIALRAALEEGARKPGAPLRLGALAAASAAAGGAATTKTLHRRVKTDVTRGVGEGTSMAAAFGELVARHARG